MMRHLQLPVAEHALVRLLNLLDGLLELDGVDLDAEELVREILVHPEHVVRLHVLALGLLHQDALVHLLALFQQRKTQKSMRQRAVSQPPRVHETVGRLVKYSPMYDPILYI